MRRPKGPRRTVHWVLYDITVATRRAEGGALPPESVRAQRLGSTVRRPVPRRANDMPQLYALDACAATGEPRKSAEKAMSGHVPPIPDRAKYEKGRRCAMTIPWPGIVASLAIFAPSPPRRRAGVGPSADLC